MAAATKTPQEQEPQKSLKEQTIETLRQRVEQLAPLRAEHEELSAMLNAINGTSAPKAPAAPKASASKPSPSAASGAPKSGTRAAQVLDVIKANSGITVSEIGNKMGVTQKNYLYRVANELREAGVVRKEGNGLVAV